MTIQEKIEKKGFSIRSNMGYRNGEQTVISYSAIKSGQSAAIADSKTALFKKL